MKRRYKILLIILVLVGLYLPEICEQQAFPQEVIDSVVRIDVDHEDAYDSSGSGFVISHTGSKTMIATCAHVVEDDPYKITVRLDDGSLITAEVVSISNTDDVAVISVETDIELQPLVLTNAGIGSLVYAVGYSSLYKYENAVYTEARKGVANITGTGKSATAGRIITFSGGLFDKPFIIINSAKTEHGDSGGPLVNQNGEVVGVSFATMEAPINLSCTVPTSKLKKFCDEAGIDYTYHFRPGLLKDVLAFGLLMLLVIEFVWAIPERKEKTT